jgi:hypothetical protein
MSLGTLKWTQVICDKKNNKQIIKTLNISMLRLTTFYDMYAINSFMAWDTYTSGAGTCYPSGAPEFIVCH